MTASFRRNRGRLMTSSINAPTDAQLNRAAACKHKYLSGRTERLQQRRDNNIRIENDPDYEPGCNPVSRRAFLALAISASISSMESWSRPACLELSHDS